MINTPSSHDAMDDIHKTCSPEQRKALKQKSYQEQVPMMSLWAKLWKASQRVEPVREAMGSERWTQLFAPLKTYYGCMDGGLIIPNMKKIGIAGVGVHMSPEELDHYVEEENDHPRKGEIVVWHCLCAACSKQDAVAVSAADKLRKRLGLTQEQLLSAGFERGKYSLMMKRNPHVHPERGFLVDYTRQCNDQRLGQMLAIEGDGVTRKFLEMQLLIAKGVLHGEEGMAEVLSPDDPFYCFIAADSRDEASQRERDLRDVLGEFPKGTLRTVLLPAA